MSKQRLNDEDRRQWVQNDEGLYNWMRSSGISQAKFIQQNRKMIDDVINNVLSGKRQAHYLAYPI